MMAKGLASRIWWTPAIFVVLARVSIARSATPRQSVSGAAGGAVSESAPASGPASGPYSTQGPPGASPPTPAGEAGFVRLEAQQQRRERPVEYADGDVDIHYGDIRLRADHVE